MKTILTLSLFLVFFSGFAQRPLTGSYHTYFGNLHNHSEISDGSGSCDYAYSYAKNVTHQDFFALTDHCISISSAEWTLLKNTANFYNEDGVFTTFWGFEWSSNALYGHVSILATDDYCTALNFSTNNFTKLCTWMNARNGVAFFNHPGRENDLGLEFGHFTSTPSDKIVGMELWNKGNGFNTWYYTDGYYSNDGNLGHYDEAIQRGWMIGASGAEDNHDADWGVREAKFVILASELTRNHLMDALKRRRFFSSLDANISMSFKIHGHEMGSSLQPGSYNGIIELSDGDQENFVLAELLKNGQVVQSFTLNDPHPVITFSVSALHNDYFYIRAHQQDGHQAISSPIFFNTNTPVNHLPVVTIASPANQSVVIPGPLQISINASDQNGSVDRVLFFVNEQYIGSDTSFPYGIQYMADTIGSYRLFVTALDDQGALGSSDTIEIEVSTMTGFGEEISTMTPEIALSQDASGQYFTIRNCISDEVFHVHSLNGALLHSGSAMAGTRTRIPTEALQPGIYLLRLPFQGHCSAVRFLVINK
jgi:hypothetical protein